MNEMVGESMRNSKRVVLILLVFSLLISCCACNGQGNGNGTAEADGEKSYDFNQVPDEVRAIKWGPFTSTNKNNKEDYYGEDQTHSVAEKVAKWKKIGFNTIYLIVFSRGGKVCFPMEDTTLVYDEEVFGPDFLKELTEECSKQGMCLYVGTWMFRDNLAWDEHPEWRQKMSGQMETDEKLMCPFSPYLEEKFYPLCQQMYDKYGIKNFFLQEMWFNWDGMGRSSSFSSYSIEAFNELTGGNWTVENVTALEAAIGDDETVRDLWYQMHFDKEVEIIDRLKSIGGGSVAWHNMRDAEWEMAMANASGLENVFINKMTLYPEIQLWDAKSVDDIDPYLTYRETAKFTNVVGGFRSVLEYYSLYGAGYSELKTSPLNAEDYVYVYLAARAAGISELVAEQEAFLNKAESQNPVAWDSITLTYAKYDPILAGAKFIGTSKGAAWADGEESTTKNRRFLTSWQNGDQEIVIAGVSLYKEPVELTFAADGKTVTDIDGNVITDTKVTIGTGEVKVFLIGEK